MNKALTDIVRKAETWPEAAQQELIDLAREIEAELGAGPYHPTPEELAGIKRGLRDAEAGRFATSAEVEAVFSKYRNR